MIQRIQQLNRGQRILIYILFMVGGVMLLVAATIFIILQTINSADRAMARALRDDVTVSEFVQLPDGDAYPASLAVGPDGTLYTGSYDTGVVWHIRGESVEEIPGTRDLIGSVTGLTVDASGTLYILDRMDSNPRAAGGLVWSWREGDLLLEYGTIDDSTGFVSPDDIVATPDGLVYVSDRGRREIWRFSPNGDVDLWWPGHDSPYADTVHPTGLAYDAVNDALIVTDGTDDVIYRLRLDDASATIVYAFSGDEDEAPGIDGVTVAADGTIYVAAFGQRQAAEIADGVLIPIAGNFRGASDVASYENRLYVTNFDQRSLVLPGINPQLPFAIDVVTWGASDATAGESND